MMGTIADLPVRDRPDTPALESDGTNFVFWILWPKDDFADLEVH